MNKFFRFCLKLLMAAGKACRSVWSPERESEIYKGGSKRFDPDEII